MKLDDYRSGANHI